MGKLRELLRRHTPLQWLCAAFALVTLLIGAALYMVVAIRWEVLVTAAVLTVLAVLLYGFHSDSRPRRIVARAMLIALPAVGALALTAYRLALDIGGYVVSQTELCVLVTLLIGTSLLLVTPAFAVLALSGRAFDVIACRIAAGLSLLVCLFTVLWVFPLAGDNGQPLLVLAWRHAVTDAALCVAAGGTVVASLETWYGRLFRKKAKK